MSTLGKVLAILNVLAAILLFVFAGMDYGEARAARYAVFRHEIVVHGLPVDNKEQWVEQPDEPVVDKLDGRVLDDIYIDSGGNKLPTAGGLNGPFVKTVLEEIARVKPAAAAAISALPAGDQQKQKARQLLLSQAKNIGERTELEEMINSDGPGMPAATAELNRRFDAVTNLHGAGGNPNWEGVRYAAAQLLVNLDADDKWQERVRVVVGFEPYVYGVESSARAMEQIAADYREGIVRDQGIFVQNYQDMILALRYEAEQLYQANKRLGELQTVVKDRKLEVEQRQTEVNKNKQELADLTAATNAEVGRLQAMQNDLFAIQQRLGKALDSTRALEEQLKKKAAPAGR
jgi:hypothetical protein